MEVIVVGLNLSRTALSGFEALHREPWLEEAESRLRAIPGVREAVRVVTCHRIEFYLGLSGLSAGQRHAAILEARRTLPNLAPDAIPDEGAIFIAPGEEAVRHLVRTATGLDSPLRGETEILGQIRAGFAAAVERKTTGPILGAVFHRAFRAARRIRARAGLGCSHPSWGEATAGAIVAGSNLRPGASVLLLGSGGLARALSVHLPARGIVVEAVQVATLRSKLRRSAVLVTVSGRGRILGPGEIGSVLHLDIWDLAVPRNVDPIAQRPGLRIRTMADVERLLPPASAPLERALRLCEQLVEAEVEEYRSWSRERCVAPTLVRLGRLLELIDPAEADGEKGGREARTGEGELRQHPFRRRLLGGMAAVANAAPSEEEATARLLLFEEALRRASSGAGSEGDRLPGGVVSLVGAGPGDPDLLTLKAARRLREADVVYHDALVSDATLALCRRDARLVPVGKRRASLSVPQEEIESALIRDARSGKRVVRLKGGDPFIFGRGGEEALTLLASGIPFEVVPGVSSGTAVPALAGIPLTHRGISSSVAFATAHNLSPGPAGDAVRSRLSHLARGADTLVLFMAGAELARIGGALLEAGLAGETPAALVESGSLPQESVSRDTLRGLAKLSGVRASGPVLLIVGRTVGLSETLGSGRSGAGSEAAGTVSAVAKQREEATKRMPGGAE